MLKPAQRLMILFASLSLLLIFPLSFTLAETTIDISGNEEGAKTNVEVKKIKETFTRSNNSTNIKTNVKVNVNGESQTVTSDGDGDVSVHSEDGSVKVDIKNRVNLTPTITHYSTESSTISITGDGAEVNIESSEGVVSGVSTEYTENITSIVQGYIEAQLQAIKEYLSQIKNILPF